jgi:hypothetical protein
MLLGEAVATAELLMHLRHLLHLLLQTLLPCLRAAQLQKSLLLHHHHGLLHAALQTHIHLRHLHALVLQLLGPSHPQLLL